MFLEKCNEDRFFDPPNFFLKASLRVLCALQCYSFSPFLKAFLGYSYWIVNGTEGREQGKLLVIVFSPVPSRVKICRSALRLASTSTTDIVVVFSKLPLCLASTTHEY